MAQIGGITVSGPSENGDPAATAALPTRPSAEGRPARVVSAAGRHGDDKASVRGGPVIDGLAVQEAAATALLTGAGGGLAQTRPRPGRSPDGVDGFAAAADTADLAGAAAEQASTRRGSALLLSGSLGMGHDVMAEACGASLARRGFTARTADSLRMLGGRNGSRGEKVFRGMIAVPGLYDAVHFSQMRTGGRLALAIERASSRYVVPALREELTEHPTDLVISIFATGAAATSRVKPEFPGLVTAVFSTDCCVHRLWVHDNTDLYLVTSQTAARYVRRFAPNAMVSVVPTPVREPFYDPPSQEEARAALGIPADAPCVLLMSGSWGLGPLVEGAAAMAAAGIYVLAVAGRNKPLAARLTALSERQHKVIPFGFTDRIPALMAASDLVVTSSGDTCSEARVIGRDLLLIDVVPGHGRDNLQKELERGHAEVTNTDPVSLTRSALACLDRVKPPSDRVAIGPQAWEQAFGSALAQIGFGTHW
ncbi:MGDG synthase family glycosyltransferase [Frankia gtarii]|uniref:MGDG synthase family glycosyltransferase n=1 Tax=Frankia gtarii TaxID=2950102 RepID=UPI0021BF5148|nr:glycosyl hydrolase [Frankia gtarii]